MATKKANTLDGAIKLAEKAEAKSEAKTKQKKAKAKDTVASIADKLTKEGISFVTYTGAEDSAEKKKAEEMVASKQARVFLSNITAAGFGLNALKNFNYIVWYCLNDSPEQIHQAQHRILRGESKTPKFAYSLFCNRTVEFKQFESNKNGEEFIKFRNTKEDFLYGS